jgi:hypothetical protein
MSDGRSPLLIFEENLEALEETLKENVIRALDGFAETLTSRVLRDFPDYAGRDENIHADAEMVVHMVADVIADYEKLR